MRVLVACEFSGAVRRAFRALGHDCWSCDLLPAEDDSPFHIQEDVIPHLVEGWDLLIAHPPCTYLSYAATKYWNRPGRAELREEAMTFFLTCYNAPIPKVCVENPVGWPNTVFRKPDQIIQPYYFGDPYRKRTCLWLRNLAPLAYDKTSQPPPPVAYFKNGKRKGQAIHWCDYMKFTKDRGYLRSKTFPGIASAMAQQWGGPA